jgi:signal transduction histidine kinase
VGQLADFVLELMAQFAGGPGAPENNLVRFGLAAIMWGVLLVIAWSRQRTEDRPRERLLIVGFGLALFRELFMLGHLSMQMISGAEHNALCSVVVPVEHALTLTSVVLIAGSFLRYILDNPGLAKRYLAVGLSATAVVATVALITWPQEMAADPAIHFHETDSAWFIHLIGSLLLVAAIVILVREQGWLRNIVILALGFFLISESLVLINFLTGRAYNQVICPIGNSFYIWAIPLFGLVYLREQGAEKRRAEEALRAYRDHLEELVEDRTTELSNANQQLQLEIEDRLQVEAEIARRNAELAAQIAIADTISQSLDLKTILNSALRRTLSLFRMDSGCIILFDPKTEEVQQRIVAEYGPSGYSLRVADDQKVCESLGHQVASDLKPRLVGARNQADQPAVPGPLGRRYSLQASTPLVVHGRGIGALTLASNTLSDMPAQELDLLRAIGLQIGVAIENARLYRQTDRWARGMARLNELSLSLNATLDPAAIYQLITHQSARLLDCPVALFYVWDQGEGRAQETSSYGLAVCDHASCSFLPAESSLLAKLIDGQQLVQLETMDREIDLPDACRTRLGERSMIGLAVRGTGAPLGILFVAAAVTGRHWSPDEVELLELFADWAAIALENAYLHQQMEWATALEERQRIAAEMHDGLAQTLNYLNFKTDQAHEMLADGRVDEVLTDFSQMQAIIDQANQDVRTSIASLQEGPLPRRSVQERLQQVAERQGQDGWPAISVESDLEEPLYVPATDLEQLARVVQEALVNANRHGRAQAIRLGLNGQDDHYELVIVDDGIGFDLDRHQDRIGNHFGLSIMRARAARLGGQLTIDSQPGAGTTVILAWPEPGAGEPGEVLAGPGIPMPLRE